MITFTRGDIFESQVQTLVNSVNCVGVMGKGIAKVFRDRYPQMFREYKRACDRGEMKSGHLFLYRGLDQNVLCFPTKDNWKSPSKYEFIEAGLRTLQQNYEEWGITSLAIPPLGCGLGGLEWNTVRQMIIDHLAEAVIPIEVYEPYEDSSHKPTSARRVQKSGRVNITLPLAIVGEAVRRGSRAMPSGRPLGRLLVQKIAFFSQFAGAPIKLRFEKYKYGPFDYSISHMIERLEGLYIRDYSSSWKNSDLRMLDEARWEKAIGEAVVRVENFVPCVDAAVELLCEYDLDTVELLATVMYGWCRVVGSGLEGRVDDVADFVSRWSEKKRLKFPAARVKSALTLLEEEGWLAPPSEDSDLPAASVLVGHDVLV